MIAVIFEVLIHSEKKNAYLNIAAELRALLEHADGFISIERFQSLSDPEKLLSLSFWRDEQSIIAWRNKDEHRIAQAQGRSGIFRDYRLRVAHVLRDYGLNERQDTPDDSQKYHDRYR